MKFVPFTPIFNATGEPAMSLPLSWDGDGVPIGVQFAARYGDEATLLPHSSSRRGHGRTGGRRSRPGRTPMTTVADLDTPVVTVDLDIMRDNIGRVQAHLSRHGIANRPHIKTHKIPAIGRMQMAAGAVGITCQKLGEVEIFVDAGVTDDILLTFNILGESKTDRLMALVKRVRRLAVVLDNDVVAQALSVAAVRHGVDLRFLVECDTGFGRTGVQTPAEAFGLAGRAMRLPRMHFDGLMTFPNRDPNTRDFFDAALALFKHAGIPVPVVSGGGTPALFTAQNFPMLTEHRAGTCVYNDAMVVSTGTATWDNCAMRVRATVVSRPTSTRAILDAGSKVLTSDLYFMKGYGHVMEYPDAAITALSEEHGTVDLTACAERPKVGDVVHVVPNHCCVVTNMVDEIYGIRNGVVEVVWPVAARGKVR
jgi:D-serine deaminase-like pyridoxal phosphate-dependent protein